MDPAVDFFAALRRMKARGSVPATAPIPAPIPVQPPVPPAAAPERSPAPASRLIGADGIALIKRFEGCARKRRDGRIEAYPDPGTGGAPWTIGWGATGRGIARGVVWTQAECDARLDQDLLRFARAVADTLAGAPTSPHQFDALVSFHYNTGAIAKATLTRLHIAGRYAEAAAEFARWINAGGKRMPGLVRRRAAEAALYRGT